MKGCTEREKDRNEKGDIVMSLFNRNLERRRFLSLSSMALGSAVLTKSSPHLLAAQEAPKAASTSSSDGTKYGKNIVVSQNATRTERGIQMFPLGGDFPGFTTIIIGRMPPPGPMPSHELPEKHEGEIETLIHLGNNPDDPLDLGADVDFYLGKGKWQEHYKLNRATAVHLPHAMWHCPWKVEKIRTDMSWVNVRVGLVKGMKGGMPGGAPGGALGGAPGGAPSGPPGGNAAGGEENESQEERAKARMSGYLFNKYLLSGAPGGMKNPEGGEWIAYNDCTRIDAGLLMRIIRYNSKGAPYSIIDTQAHEYASLFIFLGTDSDDCTNLGAEVEMLIGPEQEKHTISKSAYVYVPAETAHGPFKVTKADRPFNFLEIVAGPELPGAIYGPGGVKLAVS
jgi:hypothetical protein